MEKIGIMILPEGEMLCVSEMYGCELILSIEGMEMRNDDRKGEGHEVSNVIVNEQMLLNFMKNTGPTLSKVESKMIKESSSAAEIFAIQDDIAAFGGVIRQWRLASNLTQDELAQRAGVARSTVLSIECGIMHDGPTIGMVSKLLRVCGKKPIPCVDDVSQDHHVVGSGYRNQESDKEEEVRVVPIIPFKACRSGSERFRDDKAHRGNSGYHRERPFV